MPVYPGNILTATAATVSASPTSTRTWQWLRNGTAIPSATASTYTVTNADISAALSSQQIETNFLGATSASSAETEAVSVYSPSLLFALNEPGVWYDPSDLATLFQDNAGVSPVTTPGQTVGLMLDKSKGLVLGPEKLTNGDFASGTTGWSGWNTNAQISVSGGQMTVTQPVGGNQVGVGNTTAFATVVGRIYAVSLDLVSFVGQVQIRVGDFNGSNNAATFLFSESAGRKTGYFVANSTIAHVNVATASAAGSTITFDNVSIKELPGNHAVQATAASRPLYGIVPRGGRRNLLLQTEDFSSASWQLAGSGGAAVGVKTPNFGTAPDGTQTACRVQLNVSAGSAGAQSQMYQAFSSTGTICQSAWVRTNDNSTVNISGFTAAGGTPATLTVTGTWTRLQATAPTSGAYNFQVILVKGVNSDVADLLIWHPQSELGSTATPYQRVSTLYDVTEAGVPSCSYLAFDGVDDFMLTGTITPGVDKAQVFAGVRKLSDPAAGIILESSANVDANNGSLIMFTNPNTYGIKLRGTTIPSSVNAPTSYTAPISNVVTGLGDIAADTNTLRINGTQVAQGTADLGSGNFLAYPLYIGRRGGTTLPASMNLFGLITRFGPNLASTNINATEYWLNEKTGAI